MKRASRSASCATGPLVELLITTKPSLEDDPRADRIRACSMRSSSRGASSRSRKVQSAQVWRHRVAVSRDDAGVDLRVGLSPREHSLSNRARTRFYEREEITDLIQLLRFSTTRLTSWRSPLCFVRRCAVSPTTRCWLAMCAAAERSRDCDPMRGFSATRPLYTALRHHDEIAFISAEEHELLDRAATDQ
jgi:hypothetical protein